MNPRKARFVAALAIYLVWLAALGVLAATTSRAPRNPDAAGTVARP